MDLIGLSERALMERATLEAHAEFAALLDGRKPRFEKRRKRELSPA